MKKSWTLRLYVHSGANAQNILWDVPYAMCKAKKNELEKLPKTKYMKKSYYTIESVT